MEIFKKIEQILSCNVYEYVYKNNKNHLSIEYALLEIALETDKFDLIPEILSLNIDKNELVEYLCKDLNKLVNSILGKNRSYVGFIICLVKENGDICRRIAEITIDNYLIYKATSDDIRELFCHYFSDYKLKELVTHMILENDKLAIKSLVINPQFSIKKLPNMVTNKLTGILIDIIRF